MRDAPAIAFIMNLLCAKYRAAQQQKHTTAAVKAAAINRPGTIAASRSPAGRGGSGGGSMGGIGGSCGGEDGAYT